MKVKIQIGFELRAGTIIRFCLFDRPSLRLQAECEDHGVPTKCGGLCTGSEIVGNCCRTAGLLKMHMAINSAGEDQKPSCIDLFSSTFQILGKSNNCLTAN